MIIFRRSLWHSPNVSALSAKARALMVELRAMFNGANNGAIFLSVRDATDRLGFSDFRAATEAFEELQAVGLIGLAIAGYFNIKTGEVSKANAWRLNWIGGDGREVSPEQLPALDFRVLSSQARKRLAKRQTTLDRYLKAMQAGKFAVEETTTLQARRVEETTTVRGASVEENATPDAVTLSEARLPPAVEETTTHIDYHSQSIVRRLNPDDPSILKQNGPVESDANLIQFPERGRGACERCGTPFVSYTTGNPKRFCSERCRKQAEKLRFRSRQRGTAVRS